MGDYLRRKHYTNQNARNHRQKAAQKNAEIPRQNSGLYDSIPKIRVPSFYRKGKISLSTATLQAMEAYIQ